MKLLYFAIKGFCGNDDWQELCLDSNWLITLDRATDLPRLILSYSSVIPDNFFSTVEPKDDSPVESVSAIVGINGSGKTTIASQLSEAFCWRRMNPTDEIAVDSIDAFKHVIVMESTDEELWADARMRQKVIRIFSNLGISVSTEFANSKDKRNFKIINEMKPLSNFAHMIYHSPIFSMYTCVKENELAVKDISTRRFLFLEDNELESVDATGCRIEGYSRFVHDENGRTLTFMSELVKKREISKIKLNMPHPREIIVEANVQALDHIKAKFDEPWLKSREFDVVVNHDNGIDVFASTLLAFVLDALAEPTPPYAKMRLANEIVRKRVCTILKELSSGMREANPVLETDTKVMRQFKAAIRRPAFHAYRKSVHDLRSLCFDIEQGGEIARNLFDNDRMLCNFQAGVEMLEVIEERLWNHRKEYMCGSLRMKVNYDAIKVIGKLNDLHQKCRAGWSVSYLRFSFGLSAGEMSFLTLFSRLHEYFFWLDREVGESEWERNQILFLDESETTLHPQLQRQLVSYIIEFFEYFVPRIRVHIIFATHSPILLSDIPKGNCCFLGEPVAIDGLANTFGANIFDLYRIPFNMTTGTVGAFAEAKINSALENVARVAKKHAARRRKGLKPTNKLSKESRAILDLVGNPLISQYLNDLCVGGLI